MQQQDEQQIKLKAPSQHTRLIVVDDYEILEHIGSGANGTVYKAVQPLSGLVSAIKVLKEQRDVEDVKRFQREAQTMTKLQHPNIVAMRHFGIKDESPYLVMEYVEGESLSDLLKRGPLDVERACEIFIQLCDALQHAHDLQIYHRDIKPSNILITNRGGREIAKLADFGIAKLRSQETRETLTQTGVVLGTPLYMSPEQSMGHQPDALSDIYSLGCVMYECLTGRAPIEGDNVLEVVYKRLNNKVPTFAELGVKVSDSVANVIMRCLAHEPNVRYQSASAIENDLRAAMEGRKIAAPRRSSPPSASGSKLSLYTAAGLACLATVVAMNFMRAPAPAPAPTAAPQTQTTPTTTTPATSPSTKHWAHVVIPSEFLPLKLNVVLQGGGLGSNAQADIIFEEPTTRATYEKAGKDPNVQLVRSEWQNWYSNLFKTVNPAPSGDGPAIPKGFFGWFEVTVTRDGTVLVTPNVQMATAEHRQYADKIQAMLQALPAGSVKFPQPVSQVQFRIQVTENEKRFELSTMQPFLANESKAK